MNRRSIALLHYPVVDRNDEIYTTAVTNMDVHDIARSAKTFGVSQYYVVTPITAQQELVTTIKGFWLNGKGRMRNPDRTMAMELIDVQPDLKQCLERERDLSGCVPVVVATSAKQNDKNCISYQACKKLLNESPSSLVLFGTGHGLAPEILDQADYLLEPIFGANNYNHLSVRSAVAIILDRLFSPA